MKSQSSPLELYDKFKSKTLLWNKMVAKYPHRDYEYYFMEMYDWYVEKKKRPPQMFSAFMNWMSKTPIDQELLKASQQEYRKEEERKKREEEANLKSVSPETLSKLKVQIENFKRNVKSI